MIGSPWLTIAGLVFDVLGVAVVATNAFLSKERAVELGVMRLAGETLEENLQFPSVKHLLAESNRTKVAVALIVAGFLLQIGGSWP